MIPYSTDAPIYHYPVATVTMILLNVVCFAVFCQQSDEGGMQMVLPNGQRVESEADVLEYLSQSGVSLDDEQAVASALKDVRLQHQQASQLVLEYGTWKPWQWLTSMFMHADGAHLLGNMIFLWAFGLIVEGKIGWLGFTALYLGLGATQCAAEQSLMLWSDSGSSLGASAAVFALLAVTVTWAPENSFQCWIRVTTVEIPILVYGLLCVAKEFAFMALGGWRVSSELLHLMGFGVGLPVGLYLVHRGYVDCEGYDLFSVLQGNTGHSSTVGKKTGPQAGRSKAAKNRGSSAAPSDAFDPQLLQNQLARALAEGQTDAAIALHRKLRQQAPHQAWQQPQLLQLIQGLLKARQFERALPFLQEHLEQFETHHFALQVTLLKIWLQLEQPRKAMGYMRDMHLADLDQNQRAQLKQLVAIAKKQIAAGVVELKEDS